MLIRFPEFRRLLAALNAETGLDRVCMAEAPVPHNGLEFPADFDAELYLLANDDVGHARIPPLLHYYQHGISERRLARPALRGSELKRTDEATPSGTRQRQISGVAKLDQESG
jgi:hypothetical protein